MQLGVAKTLETFSDIEALAVDAIGIVKSGGFGFGTIPKVLDCLKQINELIVDAPAALPELLDLDAAESAQVGAAAFKLVKSVIVAIKG